MKKAITYFILLITFASSCENKTTNHSHHNTKGIEEMKMKHDTSVIENYLYDVVNSVNEIVISSQPTVKPIMREFGIIISADGYISFDERRNTKVSARFGGRVEKLFVKYNYQYVKKGEKVLELYSPEANTIQEEYIHHLSNLSEKNLIQKTKKKLLLLGMSESEIHQIENAKQALESISVYSPYEGYVLLDVSESKSVPQISLMQSGMNMEPASSDKTSEQVPISSLREGSYVTKGQTLFIVNDFKEIWAIVAFSPKDESSVKINSAATVKTSLEADQTEGRINFIEPVYKEGQKFTQARIYLQNNTSTFKINSLVSVQIASAEKKLCVRSSAVLDLGERKIAWVKIAPNKFQARNVSIGSEMNDFTEIVSGIKEHDEIAKDAGLMIDSESLITSK